jgi:hypothetical protein
MRTLQHAVERPLPQSLAWDRARRAAFLQDVMAAFTRRPGALLSFDEVSDKLHLSNVHYLDLQEIPLVLIAGSVGRYADFTRAFLPRTSRLQDRWQRVEELLMSGRDLPPVELYKVGHVYFVRDGNHRVSVARQRGATRIPALVWEYDTDVPLEPDSDVDQVLSRSARAAFVEQTDIDRLCPDVRIELTQPDGYQHLLDEIEAFRQIIARIDGREVPFDEGVALWCEMRYNPIVAIMRGRYVLQAFPGRTETDLYLWLCRNQEELQSAHGHQVLMGDAADDLAKRHGERVLSTRPARQALGWTAAAVMGRVAAGWEMARRLVGRRSRDR